MGTVTQLADKRAERNARPRTAEEWEAAVLAVEAALAERWPDGVPW